MYTGGYYTLIRFHFDPGGNMIKHELLLMRHAKSDWSAEVADYDRPLKKRGRRNATRMGLRLVEQDTLPDRIVASPARRAQQTAERVCDAIGLPGSFIHYDERIYEASVEDLVQLLQEQNDKYRRILLIGHNPGLEHLLIHLCSRVAIPDDGKLLPTASLARLLIYHDWSELEQDAARLQSITRVKSLEPTFPFPTANGIEQRERPAYFYYQSGVMPYRRVDGVIEIMLVSTRNEDDWTLPKGICQKNLTPAESAQQEAFEEAGVIVDYQDRHRVRCRIKKWGADCDLTLYAMEVIEVVDPSRWPEAYRRRQWVDVDKAASLVKQPELLRAIAELVNAVR